MKALLILLFIFTVIFGQSTKSDFNKSAYLKSLLELIPEGKESVVIGDIEYSKTNLRQKLESQDIGVRPWLNGIMYYSFGTMTQQRKDFFFHVFDVIHRNTGIQFVERTIEKDYVFIIESGVNTSLVGRIGGGQTLRISSHSYSIGIHEVMHALGFDHEQNRPDRNDYIKIIEQNIEEGQSHNFSINDEMIMYQPYDFQSVMHYPKNGFSIGNTNTIELKTSYKEFDHVIGQQDSMSQGDIYKIKAMYNHDLILYPKSYKKDLITFDSLVVDWGNPAGFNEIKIQFSQDREFNTILFQKEIYVADSEYTYPLQWKSDLTAEEIDPINQNFEHVYYRIINQEKSTGINMFNYQDKPIQIRDNFSGNHYLDMNGTLTLFYKDYIDDEDNVVEIDIKSESNSKYSLISTGESLQITEMEHFDKTRIDVQIKSHHESREVSLYVHGLSPVGEHNLSQNYPNPFNSKTRIHFEIAKSGNVQIIIYDIRGKKIKTVINSYYDRGKYEEIWNGKNEIGQEISSGIYYAVLSGKSFTRQIRMIYLK